jgi:hypothetical protein
MTRAPSARGLFLATGRLPLEEPVRDMHDFYATPWEPTHAFLNAERQHILGAVYSSVLSHSIWEPAAGDGAMARVMEAHNFAVHCSDLVDRGVAGCEIRDFFDFKTPRSDVLITNPPYALTSARGKARWILHARSLGVRYMALLLNWDWCAAKGMAPVLDEWPISRVYVCRWKVDFTGKGAPPQRNAFFVWDSEWRGETVLRYLDRPAKGDRLD